MFSVLMSDMYSYACIKSTLKKREILIINKANSDYISAGYALMLFKGPSTNSSHSAKTKH